MSDECDTIIDKHNISGEGNYQTFIPAVTKGMGDRSQPTYARSRTPTNAITIPERQRKAASMQYHTPTDNDILQNIDHFNSPRVVSCNFELFKTDDGNDVAISKKSEKPNTLNLNLDTASYNPCHQHPISFSKKDSKMQRPLHLAVSTGSHFEVSSNQEELDHSSTNIGNSFSVPTSPTDACASSPIYSSHDEHLYTGNHLLNINLHNTTGST